jgi:uncharacterized protein YbjT (DUF2867 family)
MRAAVIGATGFVGRALVPVLARRGEVVAISRRGAAAQGAQEPPPAADDRVLAPLRGTVAALETGGDQLRSLGPEV